MSYLSSEFVTPVLVVTTLIAVFAGLWLISRNYIKVSPNAVAVLSGRKRKLPDGRVVGYRMVKGGAALRIPLLEKVEYLHLNVMTIPLEIKRAYTLKGVPVSVKAVANVKIRGDETSLQAAAERFLGMTHVEVQKVIFQTLEGHLRSILGTLTVEEVNSDRQSFAQKLTSEAAADLEKMGLGVDVLTIQEISDEEEYLNALGKRRTAEVKRDATIGEAEAMRDSKIKSAQAMQEGEKAKFQADAEIAQSQRDFAIRQAQYQAEVEKERATADQSGPLSSAKARQSPRMNASTVHPQIRVIPTTPMPSASSPPTPPRASSSTRSSCRASRQAMATASRALPMTVPIFPKSLCSAGAESTAD